MATDIQQGVFYGEPISGDPEIKVTRQVGLAIDPAVGIDPTPPPPIIQGDPLTVVERNQGPHVRGHFDGNVFFADHIADTDQILYADSGMTAIGEAYRPPGLARIAAPLAPTAAPLPPPSGFGPMPREAVKAAAEAAGFIVTEPKDSPVPFAIIASDQPGDLHDPRDRGDRGPQVITALPVIKKAPIVPVVTSAPDAVIVRAERTAATLVASPKKKGKR